MTDLFLFGLAFVLLWLGSGLAVGAISQISHILRASSFVVSFFVLGLFTSITEIMVGINAVIEGKPEIYVGNLLGGSVVIFLFIIPILAVAGNGVRLNHYFKFKNLVSAIFAIGLPALLTLDNRFGILDALVSILVYGYFIFMLESGGKFVNRILTIDIAQKTLVLSFFKMVSALILVFTASRILVDQTPRLGEIFSISPYIISILVLAIGTNIPELSIAIRSIISKKKDIAFGNYVGSATLNTLEIGVLTLFGKTGVPAEGSNYSILAYSFGLSLFIYFVKSKNDISKREGLILLFCYFLFVIFELFTGSGWNIKSFT